MSLKRQKIMFKSIVLFAICILILMNNFCFATNVTSIASTDSIGTAEVQAATDNIKRVIVSIAMPLRRRVDFCKCCNSSIKNDN